MKWNLVKHSLYQIDLSSLKPSLTEQLLWIFQNGGKLVKQELSDIGASQDRSVLIQWLRRNYNDPVAFLNHIHHHGFDPSTRVCGVYPKEREGKTNPECLD